MVRRRSLAEIAVGGIERKVCGLSGRLVTARGLHRVAGAGAVHQDAFLAVRRACAGKGRIDLRVGGDIDLAEHAADLPGDGFALLHVEVEDGDLDAVGSERARGGCAKAGRAAGDDRGDR